MDEVSLLERLRAGVRVADVSQSGAELYDIDDAETAMSEAAAAIERIDYECHTSMATIASERARAEAAEARAERLLAERDEARAQLEIEDASRDMYCSICGSCGSDGCGCEHKCIYSLSHPDAVKVVDDLTSRAEATEAQRDKLREALREAYALLGFMG